MPFPLVTVKVVSELENVPPSFIVVNKTSVSTPPYVPAPQPVPPTTSSKPTPI